MIEPVYSFFEKYGPGSILDQSLISDRAKAVIRRNCGKYLAAVYKWLLEKSDHARGREHESGIEC